MSRKLTLAATGAPMTVRPRLEVITTAGGAAMDLFDLSRPDHLAARGYGIAGVVGVQPAIDSGDDAFPVEYRRSSQTCQSPMTRIRGTYPRVALRWAWL